MHIFAPMTDPMVSRPSPFRCQRAYEGMLRTLLSLDPFRFEAFCFVAELGPHSPLLKKPAALEEGGAKEAGSLS